MDKEFIDILKRMIKPCQTGQTGTFPEDNGKVLFIKEYLKESPLLFGTPSVICYGQTDFPKVILSAHIDTVPSMKHFFLNEDEKNGFLYGNFDNALSDAVLVSLIKDHFRKDVWYCFTADEETGRCRGIKDVLSMYFDMLGREDAVGIALDCTYENKNGFTIENIRIPEEKRERGLFSYLYEKKLPFRAVYPYGAKANASLHEEDISAFPSWFDEGTFYGDYIRKGILSSAFSICIPVMGEMHADSGCMARTDDIEAFLSGTDMILSYFTKTEPLYKEPDNRWLK